MQGEFGDFGLEIVADGCEKLSFGDSESRGSLQGNVCAADPELLLDGSASVSGVLRNSLSEDLEVLNLNSYLLYFISIASLFSLAIT